MGYFANGFVFNSEPDFEAVALAVTGHSLQGYRNDEGSLWLLDAWKPLRKLRQHDPFCDRVTGGFRGELADIDLPTRTFLETLEQLIQSLCVGNTVGEISYVHLALAVSSGAGCPVYFFAADDEETDMGCRCVPGSLVSFSCRLDRLSVQYTDGQVVITPLNFLEDDDIEGLIEVTNKVKAVPGVLVQTSREIEGGQVFYENPVLQWPKEYGDAGGVLGLGTWDPLIDVESNFTVVFERFAE